MIKEFEIIGDISNYSTINIDVSASPIEIMEIHQIQMRDNRRVIGVQIGGALGNIAFGNEMLEPVSARIDGLASNQLLYLSSLFCPVDYLRFLTRFLIREVKIDTEASRNLYDWINGISIGKSSKHDFSRILYLLAKLDNSYAEVKVREIYKSILKRFEEEIMEHIEDKKCTTGICRTLISAQCSNACPADVNIPGYVALMKNGDHEMAYKLMRQTNPLSLICGKICARPCEARCRRKEIEDTVGVRALQRYASNYALNLGNWQEDKKEVNGRSVAVIGGGPAGLSAAYYLQKTGYRVEIYEELGLLGGMLSSAVPAYRMPSEDLKKEIDTILALGVKVHLNCSVGKDVSLEALREDFDAVIIATGAKNGNRLDDLMAYNTETAVDFLKSVRLENRQLKEECVTILGGGDVAIDAARTAKRLGAKTVRILSLEEIKDLPADREEVDVSLKEGIEFISGYGIKTCDADLNMTLKKCYQVIAYDGAFAPRFHDNETREISSDLLILAVGQHPDLSFSKELKRKKRFLEVDKKTGRTSIDGIYAVGDVVKNDIAISAIAGGKRIAQQVDLALDGVGIYSGQPIDIPEKQLLVRIWDQSLRKEKQDTPELIEGNFSELTKTYSEEDALYEANRCMRCDRNSIAPLMLRE